MKKEQFPHECNNVMIFPLIDSVEGFYLISQRRVIHVFNVIFESLSAAFRHQEAVQRLVFWNSRFRGLLCAARYLCPWK